MTKTQIDINSRVKEQMGKLKTNIEILRLEAELASRDRIIDELKQQLRITQDELYSESVHPLGADYRPTMSWVSRGGHIA